MEIYLVKFESFRSAWYCWVTTQKLRFAQQTTAPWSYCPQLTHCIDIDHQSWYVLMHIVYVHVYGYIGSSPASSTLGMFRLQRDIPLTSCSYREMTVRDCPSYGLALADRWIGTGIGFPDAPALTQLRTHGTYHEGRENDRRSGPQKS